MDADLGLSYWEIILRLVIATAIGMLFGFERKRSKKPVGIRTHVLVSLAACIIAIVSAYGFTTFIDYYPSSVNFTVDPARLLVGMLTGIGFIGAGIIWKSKTGIIGITTAAEIFLLAALGIAVGLGFYFLVIAATIIAIINMIADDLWVKWKKKRQVKKGLSLETLENSDEAAVEDNDKCEVKIKNID